MRSDGEFGEDALDELRGCRHLQYANVATPKQLCLFANRGRVVEKSAAVRKHLFTFACENKSAPDPVEKLEPELMLKFVQLTRQCGLGDMKMLRRLRHGPEFDHGDKASRTPKVDHDNSCRLGIDR
ncbi:hypothetical protein NKJ01_01790 [Mesorhizobium sp. M0276]